MNKELEILRIADYYEKFTVENANAYLIVNKNMQEYNCMFGFVDIPNDIEKVEKLFNLIEEKAKSLGYKEIVGPINYTTWLSYRWALNKYDIKLYPDCDNPSYYVDIIRKLGYKELYTYRSATIDINNKLYKMGKEILKQKQNEGYEFRFYYGEEVYDKIKEIYDVSINAFEGSYLYTQLPYLFFEKIYLEWTKKINVAVYIAYKDEKAVGYVMGYKNIYSNDFISKTSAVLKEYQKNNVYLALLYLGCNYAIGQGFKDMVYHFQCEQKLTFKKFEDNIESNEKKYAVYIKELQ